MTKTSKLGKNQLYAWYNLRSFSVAELGPFGFNPGISFSRLVANLPPDVLSFPVTISPNKQAFAVFCLFLNVFGNCSFVLYLVSLGYWHVQK